MVAVGKPGVPALLKALKDDDEKVRLCIASALRGSNARLPELVPPLVDLLQEDDPEIRRAAIFAPFAHVKPQNKEAVGPIIKVLKDTQDGHVQEYAVGALGIIGPDAKGALPQVHALLNHKFKYVREAAAAALKKIDPEAAKKAGVR